MALKNTKPKVLLIEDDPDQIHLYEIKFKLEGFDIISAEKGSLGIALAREQKPDVILLDLIMDEMGGLDVLRALKALEETRSIPVFLFTNLAKKELAEKGRDLGAAGFIIKADNEPSRVVEMVNKILGKIRS